MLRSLHDFQKFSIAATDGLIGEVTDLFFDDKTWVIRYLIVDTGSWLSSRKVLVSPIAVHKVDWEAHELSVGFTMDQLRNSPDIDLRRPVSRQHELQYLGYYGYPAYWGGLGIWGGGALPLALYPGGSKQLGMTAQQQLFVDESAAAQRAKQQGDDPHLRSCKAVVGYHVHANNGNAGHVEGLLVDESTWAIRYLVVYTSNWWIGHKMLIAPQWIAGLHWEDRTVEIDLSREALSAAPAFDPSARLDRPTESRLYSHFGRSPYWHSDGESGQEF